MKNNNTKLVKIHWKWKSTDLDNCSSANYTVEEAKTYTEQMNREYPEIHYWYE